LERFEGLLTRIMGRYWRDWLQECFGGRPALQVKSSRGSGPSAETSFPLVAAQPRPKLLYAVTIFASAFLLFQAQPMIAKMILPQMGGAASVWLICLLFFQAVLMLGYAYAHVLTRTVAAKVQRRIHAALLAGSFVSLRFLLHISRNFGSHSSPEARVLLLLVSSVGFPYFLLSSTTPLLQAWYAQALDSGATYRFYALSNAGSLLALLSYPLAIEPLLSSSRQAIGWAAAYAGFAILCGMTAFSSAATSYESALKSSARPGWRSLTLWACLAACGSALLLGITSHISQNIAPVPLLWIIPLTLYLLSFILCFEGHNWYRRGFFLRLLAVALGAMTYALSQDFSNLPLRVLVPLFCGGLFVCCMVCHGELARLKPAPDHLTTFYFMCSLGGVLGAVFVATLAPHIFAGFYELPITLGFCTVLVLFILRRDPDEPFYRARWSVLWFGTVALAGAIIAGLCLDMREQAAGTEAMVRNFYGVLRVRDQKMQIEDDEDEGTSSTHFISYRRLINGTITHGLQFLSPELRDEPTTYYSRSSGVGIALETAGKSGSLRVGAIGLGAGTIAAYGRPGDRFTFYEINPLVIQVANEEFSFLRDSRAQVTTVLGDARLTLQSQPPQNYDLLVVDAFSGDAIPIHLLTREAFLLYFRQLKTNGLLLVHVSNKHLDLPPVVWGSANSLGKSAALVDNGPDRKRGISSSTWIVVGQGDLFDQLRGRGKALDGARRELWTDDHSSLLPILK
jgi:hypothetical protein